MLSVFLPTVHTCGVVFNYCFRPNSFSNIFLALIHFASGTFRARELCDGQRNKTISPRLQATVRGLSRVTPYRVQNVVRRTHEVRDHHYRCTTCSEVHDLFPFPQFAFSELEASHDDWNTLFSISVGDPLCQRVPLCLRAVKVPVRVPPPLNLDRRTSGLCEEKEIMHHSRQNNTVRVMYWRKSFSIIPPFFCIESILELFARARLSLHLDIMASTTLGDFIAPFRTPNK